MPMGQREQPLRSGGGDGSDSGKAGLRGGGVFTEVPMQLYEAGGIGGDGGVGGGLKFLKPLLSIDDALKVAFPDMTAVEFCEQHDLGDEVRQFLEEQGFDPVDALLYADEVDMMDEGFQVGQIAEVKWALKKILLETFDTLVAAKIKGTNKPDISGGTGGVGGYGGQAGGGGGFGAPPRFPVEEAYRFGRISGGIGGEGGASRSPRGPNENQQSPSRKTETVTDVAQFPPLFGGTGGRGGWGDVVGGVGGLW
ncbi:hypothetical protein MVEN_01726300 [Mycena venus]|uniref:SAM domain-containing protein n=1 Tax=Mycena venus TaxID=2733690 RepID=A0A8H6XL10_9AGAR|nr:hypothetical protein MVEN_01726300 [Mycena venus]